MGRKRVNRTPEETKKLRQQYYQYHREEILKKAKERRETYTPSPNSAIKSETALQSFLNEWCGQLQGRVKENLPQWLEIGLQRQIEIIKAMLTNQ